MRSEWYDIRNSDGSYNNHISGMRGTGIWSCPSLDRLESTWAYKFGGYNYNANGCRRDPANRSLGLGGDIKMASSPNLHCVLQPTRERDVSAPAALIAIGDVDAVVEQDFFPPPLPMILSDKGELRPTSVPGWIAAGIIPDQPGNRLLKAWQGAISIRHAGRWHVLYCDGHVEKMRIQDLFNIRDQEVRRRWNRDHAPHTEITLQIDPLLD